MSNLFGLYLLTIEWNSTRLQLVVLRSGGVMVLLIKSPFCKINSAEILEKTLNFFVIARLDKSMN